MARPRLRVVEPSRFDAVVAADLLARMTEISVTRGRVVVTLPFGRTPTDLYGRWVRADYDWSRVVFVSGDEYLGLGPDDPDSGAAYLTTHLIGPLLASGEASRRLQAANVRLLDGRADPQAEARGHEAFIADHGGIDIALLGVGSGPPWRSYRAYRWLRSFPRGGALVARLAAGSSSPHLWFNESGASFDSRTRVVELSPHTQRANELPHERALTLGLQNVVEARAIVLLAKGVSKRSALDLMLAGPATESVPVSLLGRPDVASRVVIYADSEAARGLD
jgi:glucosamine-6-phosphate deaminase